MTTNQAPFASSVVEMPRTGVSTWLDTNGLRGDFPGLAGGWHYLDTAATAQKPQAVIDATVRALGADYATVHRGVYARSADMTLAYEAARARVASFIGGQADEVVFVRGATEAINLVAQSLCSGDSPILPKGARIMLSQLEHHSNIVPWQLAGYQIDVCPLTHDGQIDLEWLSANLTTDHKLVALAHVSNVLGSVLDAARVCKIARQVSALVLLDGCQAAARMTIDVATLGCDFYTFSGHKLYGPTGVGVLWGRAELLGRMPPWQGGGAMIDKVSFAGTTYAAPPARFEAGTPAIAEVLGLHAAIDYVANVGLDAICAHETALVDRLRGELSRRNDITLFGPANSAGIVSFSMDGVHPHDLGTILDEAAPDGTRVAIRAGHHCAQPLMEHLGVPATARASFGLYSDERDIAALLRGIERTRRIFG